MSPHTHSLIRTCSSNNKVPTSPTPKLLQEFNLSPNAKGRLPKLGSRWPMLISWHEHNLPSMEIQWDKFLSKYMSSHVAISSTQFEGIMHKSKFINIILYKGVTCKCNPMIMGIIQDVQLLKLSHGDKWIQGSHEEMVIQISSIHIIKEKRSQIISADRENVSHASNQL